MTRIQPRDGARAATFGEFGVAVVAEVFSPRLLHTLLIQALETVRHGGALADVADIASARIDMPTLIGDDGYERSFAVTIRVVLESRLGPRLWAMGIDTTMDLELTMRLSIFEPAVAQLTIDPVTSDKLRVRARARTDWLPVPLLDGGGMTRLARTAERSLSIFSATLNRAIDGCAAQLRLDVLGYLREAHRSGASTGHERGGTAGEPRRAGGGGEPSAVLGERISFAEFGEVLIRGGVDVRSVATVIDTVLAPGARFAIDGPIPLDADVAARLARITVEPADGDELLFRVSLDIDVEVARPKAADNAVLIIVLRVQTVLRVSTLINPAALRVTFQPVSPEDVRLLQVRGKLRGGWLPLPGGALSRLVRRRIADELNRRFHDVGRHIVIAELVANRPPER